jgi:thioesterase domain-containing protein
MDLSVQQYIFENMPLTESMGIQVLEYQDQVRLAVPLGPNLNHKSTAFGGSISAALITAGWLEVRRNLDRLGNMGEIVIQKSTVDYLQPVESDFEVHAVNLPSHQWFKLKSMLGKYGKGRVSVDCLIGPPGNPRVTFTGQYVVLLPKG